MKNMTDKDQVNKLFNQFKNKNVNWLDFCNFLNAELT